jgi:RNA polymerase sigma factor (sigma-70 family)
VRERGSDATTSGMEAMAPTRHELVERARAGDHEAFTALVTLSIHRLYGVARMIVRDDHRAEDALQDAMVRAWLNIRGLRDAERFDAWLHRLVVHACYTAARRERARQLVEIPAVIGTGPAASDALHLLPERDLLERAFRRLSPEQRAVLAVHFYLDLSDAEAAHVLAIPVGTMKSRLNRALSAMRAAMAAEDRAPVLAGGRLG